MNSDSPPLLEVIDVKTKFAVRKTIAEVALRRPQRHVVALDGISLALHPHESLGIVGESGSGKSTIAKVIVGLVPAQEGAVLFEGADVLGMRRDALRAFRRRVQMIYQDPYSSLNPRLTVAKAISEPAQVHGLVSGGDTQGLVIDLLRQVGLSDTLASRRPRALSGGQRQRVAIARALAVQPEVLVADEATSALDVSIQAQILNLFAGLREQLGLSVIFISHQLSVVSNVTDRVAVMYLGRIVETGPTAEVFGNPAHPYTLGLMEAQPGRQRRERARAPALAGEIPSGLDIPRGCRFRTRCPIAEDVCKEVDPPGVAVADGHVSWCHVMPRDRTAPMGADEPATSNGSSPVQRPAPSPDVG